jgi:hypothetical protein
LQQQTRANDEEGNADSLSRTVQRNLARAIFSLLSSLLSPAHSTLSSLPPGSFSGPSRFLRQFSDFLIQILNIDDHIIVNTSFSTVDVIIAFTRS